MTPLRGKLAFGFEERASGPNELAAQRRHSSCDAQRAVIRHRSSRHQRRVPK
jgi:hypothetical protein